MKVGQKVLVRTIHRIRLCGYKHRHKLYVKTPGWNIWGNIEVKEIMEVLKLMVEIEEGDEIKFFCEHPHSTWDNNFSGYQIMNCICENSFGDMMACMWDRSPGGIQGK